MPEDPVYFVASLGDTRTVFVNFSSLSVILLGENANPILVQVTYKVVDDLLFVNNETHCLVYNWTRISMCPDDLLTAPVNFDLVHSFSDQSLSEECGCVRDIVTTATPTDNTTTNQTESAKFTTSTTETASRPTTERPTDSLSPAVGPSAGGIAGIAIVAVVVVFLIVLAITVVFVCLRLYM